ncbi:YesL family protein, partial [Pseudalkalibacillus sp. NRS-1564]
MVELNGLWGKFYRITEWVARLVYVQCLWLVFSIVGLLVAGIFPATMGMFAVVRRWQLGETDVPVFPEFWTTYKQEFIK